MNLFKDNFREFNYYLENRLIFQGGSEVQSAKPETVTPEPESTEAPQTHEEFKAETFSKIETKFGDKLRGLKEMDSAKVDALKAKFQARLAELKGEYDVAFTRLAENRNDTKQHIHDEFNTFLEEHNLHTVEAVPAAPKVAKADTETVTTEPKTNETATETTEITKGREKAREIMIKGILKDISPSSRAVLKLIQGNNGEVKSLEEILKNPKVQEMMTKIVNGMTEEQIKQVKKGEMITITKEYEELVRNTVLSTIGMEQLDDKSDEEIKNLKTLKLGEKSFDEIFGEGSPIAELISRQYEVKMENGKMQIAGKDINDLNDLKQFLPEGYDAVIDAPDDDHKELLKKLDGLTTEQTKAMALINDTFDGLLGGGAEGLKKKPGMMESLGMLIALWKAITSAIASGDWATLNDFMEDFKEGPEAVKKNFDASKKSYGEALLSKDNPNNKKLGTLLMAHREPRGEHANTLFGEEGPSSRYRTEAKPAIAKHLKTKMGLTGTVNITHSEGNNVTITAFNKGKPITIEINLDNPNNPISTISRTVTVKGEGDKEDTTELKPIADGETKIRSLADIGLLLGAEQSDTASTTATESGGEDVVETITKKPKSAEALRAQYKDLLEGLEAKPQPNEASKNNDLYIVINSLDPAPEGQPVYEKGIKQNALDQDRRDFILTNIVKYEPILKMAKTLFTKEAKPNPKGAPKDNELFKLINADGKHPDQPKWGDFAKLAKTPIRRQRALDQERRAYILKNMIDAGTTQEPAAKTAPVTAPPAAPTEAGAGNEAVAATAAAEAEVRPAAPPTVAAVEPEVAVQPPPAATAQPEVAVQPPPVAAAEPEPEPEPEPVAETAVSRATEAMGENVDKSLGAQINDLIEQGGYNVQALKQWPVPSMLLSSIVGKYAEAIAAKIANSNPIAISKYLAENYKLAPEKRGENYAVNLQKLEPGEESNISTGGGGGPDESELDFGM